MLALRSLAPRQCLRAAPRAAAWSVAVRTNLSLYLRVLFFGPFY